jgi:hypothetical protein
MRGGGVGEREREKERRGMCDIGAGIVCMYRMDEERQLVCKPEWEGGCVGGAAVVVITLSINRWNDVGEDGSGSNVTTRTGEARVDGEASYHATGSCEVEGDGVGKGGGGNVTVSRMVVSTMYA